MFVLFQRVLESISGNFSSFIQDKAKTWKFYHKSTRATSVTSAKTSATVATSAKPTKPTKSATSEPPRRQWGFPFIDICFFEIDGDILYDIASREKYSYPLALVFPLLDRPFHHLTVPAPAYSRMFLRQTYDIEVCDSNKRDHEHQGHLRGTIVECQELKQYYPFVNYTSGTEVLMFQGHSIE